MSLAPAYLTLVLPSGDETDSVNRMIERLSSYNVANMNHQNYYEGTFTPSHTGFSIPPNMRDLKAVSGWGGTVVDVLDERLDWLGWRSDGDALGLQAIYAANQLDVESGMGHLDALIYGTSFITVGTGQDGEPDQIITAQSPLTTTAVWDRRRRRVSEALTVVVEDGQIVQATRYSAEETTVFERGGKDDRWVVLDRDQHNLGRVPVVQMPNRMRASDVAGRSEITPAVRYYADSAVRTLMGVEVHREFYQAPQRWAMNVDPKKFVNSDGKPVSPWQSIQGRVWAIPPNEDDQPQPQVGQFTPASPAPYIDQIKNLATLLSAEAGMPVSYLGYASDNPASADAIRAGEARLVKRAERRQTVFGAAWLEAARLALLVRDGEIPAAFSDVSVRWRDPSTPTRAAAADEAVKLVGSGVLAADSTVTYDRIGLDPDEQRQVDADKRRAAGRALLDQLAPEA